MCPKTHMSGGSCGAAWASFISEDQEDQHCFVCGDADFWDDNQIVFCEGDGCTIAVRARVCISSRMRGSCTNSTHGFLVSMPMLVLTGPSELLWHSDCARGLVVLCSLPPVRTQVCTHVYARAYAHVGKHVRAHDHAYVHAYIDAYAVTWSMPEGL